MMMTFQAQDYPQNPGVYRIKDGKDTVLYVGKAKNLRKRIASYFRPEFALSSKTRSLMQQADKIETMVTQTEKEALLLEASLIKEHRPKYNVVLRDDKNYLLFRLDKKEPYPWITLTRKATGDHARYFGPFTSALAARNTWKLINRLFPLRKCGNRVFRNRSRPCLQYHIHRCLAPCVRNISREEYAEVVHQVVLFLSGQTKELLKSLELSMKEASDRMEFEKAARIRDLMHSVRKTVQAQGVVLNKEMDMDVIGYSTGDKGITLGVMFVRRGRLLDQVYYSWPGYEDRDMGWDLMEHFLLQFYHENRFIPRRIILPISPEEALVQEVLSERRSAPVTLARARGKAEKSLLNTTIANAQAFAEKNMGEVPLVAGPLRLPAEPWRIEAVDISHLGGKGTYAGQVVFEGALPCKEGYRLYKFPELESSRDDYQALSSWMKRRAAAGPPWPDLLLVDGGKGQLSSVARAIQEEDIPDFPVRSIAKGGQGREGKDQIFMPNRKNPLPLKEGSPALLFLQKVRDEVHRFVVTAQRKSRRQSVRRTSLESVPGIGPKTARNLLQEFGSLDGVLQASAKELSRVEGIGEKKSRTMHEALKLHYAKY